MSLSKTTTVDKIEVVGEFKTLLVKEITKITEDGNIVAEKLHRSSHQPDTDVSTLPADVQLVANAVWTQAIKDAYAESLEVE